MNKFWIILSHTYLTRLKSKSFIITTLITALVITGLANSSKIADLFTGGETEAAEIAVIDRTEVSLEPLRAQLEAADTKITLTSFSGSAKEAEQQVKDATYTGLLIIETGPDELPQGTYKAMQIAEQKVSGALENALQQVKVAAATSQLGLSGAEVAAVYSPVQFEQEALLASAKTAEELNQARGLVYILLFVIYFSVIFYGNMIAMEVAIEKSSRVMEIIISSVSPVKQMFGKILGIALLGLTQYIFIIGIGYYSLKENMDDLQGGFFDVMGLGGLPLSTFVYAVVFFILGYFFFATLAAMLGSLVSRIEDAQQMIMPMTLLIVAAFMIAMFGLTNPETMFITITSFIPPFTPMIMFLRVGMLNVPAWEVALSIGLMIVSILALAVIASKVYRGGVLMYGKSTSLKDLKKAMKLS
ncbi:ABC transporter permease [Bacillus marinisedimentorum]|uniref:ABC transporter permease n=1 Tax=Bacillus marinisedimentorum TaxID=1821260 RepID=UPI0007DFA293|nr:ABC transporter permease [Bacillus marinisedimentorum]